MDKNLDCEIVRDLLPSYADGLTSGGTNRAVEAHLATCPDCAAALRRMREPEALAVEQTAEVDYLKRVRRRTKRTSLIVGILLMLLGMGLLGFRYFYVGTKAAPEDAAFHVTVEGDTARFTGTLTGSGLGVSRIVFSDSAGIVTISVYTAPKTPFNSGDFTAEYTSHGAIGAVRCGDLFLWEGGVEISHTAAALYRAMNPFVGDMPANSRVAQAVGVANQLGPFENELQTATEPYGWTLLLENPIPAAEERAAQDVMTADAYVMLATIENLGYVEWTYESETGPQTYTVTAAEAAAFAGQDIKKCASSPSALQALVEMLRIKWAGVQ